MELIALDIGNSSINIGFFVGSDLHVLRFNTWPLLSQADYQEHINGFIREKNMDKMPGGIVISSVVPGHTSVLKDALKGLVPNEPLLVNHKIKSGLKFKIPNPEKLGSDRIANAVAAYELYKNPVAVVDCGTASTISVVGRDAAFIGGAIIPGIQLMNESLSKGAVQLSEVPADPPESALGVDTMKCIQSGLFYGSAGAIEKILYEIERECGFKLKTIVTGGYGHLISKFMKKKYDFHRYLTLEGLKIIFLRNRDA